jgi:hypothetical protein
MTWQPPITTGFQPGAALRLGFFGFDLGKFTFRFLDIGCQGFDFAGQFLRPGLESRCRSDEDTFAVVDVFERAAAGDRFDPAQAGADARFADDFEQGYFRRACDMTAAA